MTLSANLPGASLPSVSVVIPAYNSETFLGRCLESVLGCDYPAELLQIICVDNGSRDRTAEIARRFAPAVQLVLESKRGPAAARNAGLRAARQSIVAFTDSDCVVDRAWLRRIVEPIQAKRASAVGGRILARPEAGPVERFGELVHDHAKALEYFQPPYLITMNAAMPRELLLSLGGFDERWIRLEDVELTYRILGSGHSLAYQPDAVIHHHNRDTLPRLAREGFLHGYYRGEFLRAHREFIRTYRERSPMAHPAPPVEPPAASSLRPWQVRLFWNIFNCGKKAGEVTGRWFPPKVEDMPAHTV